MYEIDFIDLVNDQKVSSWFSVEDIADLQVQRESNKKTMLEKSFKKNSEKWLNNQMINLMNKAIVHIIRPIS